MILILFLIIVCSQYFFNRSNFRRLYSIWLIKQVQKTLFLTLQRSEPIFILFYKGLFTSLTYFYNIFHVMNDNTLQFFKKIFTNLKQRSCIRNLIVS